jgi:hypothetical protein
MMPLDGAARAGLGCANRSAPGHGWLGGAGPRPDWGGDRSEFPGRPHRKAVSRRHGLLITDRWIKQTADVETPKRLLDRDDLDSFRRRAGRGWKNPDNVWSYNVGLARRRGVRVDVATNPADIADFATLYHTVADSKGLVVPGRAAQWGAQAFPPQDSRGKTRNLLRIVPFRPQFIFSHFIAMMRPRTWWGGSARMSSSVLVIAFTND